MPIGNLTSQIFANIYLNELDGFVKHKLKVKYYLRYGDDFILIHSELEKLVTFRERIVGFLENMLKLSLNPKNDKILKASHGLRFLGVVIWTKGRKLKKRNKNRIKKRLNCKNVSSYYGLVLKHGSQKTINEFAWLVYSILNSKN